MTTAEEEALTVLSRCSEAEECSRLAEFVNGERPVEYLTYEDVFYPLRHHHREGLALEFRHRETLGETLVWGPGDLIFRADDSVRTLSTAVDPFVRWRDIVDGAYSVTVTIVDEATEEVDDAA